MVISAPSLSCPQASAKDCEGPYPFWHLSRRSSLLSLLSSLSFLLSPLLSSPLLSSPLSRQRGFDWFKIETLQISFLSQVDIHLLHGGLNTPSPSLPVPARNLTRATASWLIQLGKRAMSITETKLQELLELYDEKKRTWFPLNPLFL